MCIRIRHNRKKKRSIYKWLTELPLSRKGDDGGTSMLNEIFGMEIVYTRLTILWDDVS